MLIPEWIELLAQIAVIGALLVAAYQAYLLRIQLENSERNQKAQRVFEFIERWNDPTFSQLRIPVVTFVRSHSKDFSALKTKADAEPDFRGNFHLILNSLEEMGLAWNTNNLDRDLFSGFFASIVEINYQEFATYITHKRGEISERLWRQFTRMREDIEKELKKEGEIPKGI